VTSSTTTDSCGVLDNTARFTSTNAGSGEDSATTMVDCPAEPGDINIEKYTRVEVSPTVNEVCPTLGKPVSMTFEYTGQNVGPGMPYDNQDGRVSYTGNPNGASPVTVTVSGMTVTPSTVQVGERFTISGSWKSQTDATLAWAGGTSTVSFHTSCSKPIRMGDQYGSLVLVGYVGQSGTTQVPPSTSELGEDADTPTGPEAVVGDTVTWNYVVTNPGAVPISDVTVVDDHGTPGNASDDFSPMPVLGPDGRNVGDANGDGLLDPGEEWLFRASDVARAGQYGNIAVVTGRTPSNEQVTDDDPSHYFGVFPATGTCETFGKPVALTFMYTGDQFPTSHSQTGNKFWIENDGATGSTSPATIRVVSPAQTRIVPLNESFTVNGPFGSNTVFEVLDAGGTVLQRINIHTSCSAPLNIGDQFGSLKLIGFIGQSGGFSESASISGQVWNDLNGNGALDSSEPGIAGVAVRLFQADGTTPARDLQGNLIATASGADGSYRFEQLQAGTYVVAVDTDSAALQPYLRPTTAVAPTITLGARQAVTASFGFTSTVCGDGRPQALTFQNNGVESALIRVTDKSNPFDTSGKYYFAGQVDAGASFTAFSRNAGENRFPSTIYVHRYAPDGSSAWSFPVTTSCSQPLFLGQDFWGGLFTLVGSVPEGQAVNPPAWDGPVVAAGPTVSSKNVDFNLVNLGGNREIERIEITWPTSPNTRLNKVTVAGKTIWDARSTTSPTVITAFKGNVGERTLRAGAIARLRLEFDANAAPSGYEVIMTFVGGDTLVIPASP
jgi:hypothetical protein